MLFLSTFVYLKVSFLNHHFGRIFSLVLEFKLADIFCQHFNNVIPLFLSSIMSLNSLSNLLMPFEGILGIFKNIFTLVEEIQQYKRNNKFKEEADILKKQNRVACTMREEKWLKGTWRSRQGVQCALGKGLEFYLSSWMAVL